jgi:hypothetical protein
MFLQGALFEFAAPEFAAAADQCRTMSRQGRARNNQQSTKMSVEYGFFCLNRNMPAAATGAWQHWLIWPWQALLPALQGICCTAGMRAKRMLLKRYYVTV